MQSAATNATRKIRREVRREVSSGRELTTDDGSVDDARLLLPLL
jgi:hypothetical protein